MTFTLFCVINWAVVNAADEILPRAQITSPRGTLTLDERGVSLVPRDPACPAITGTAEAFWTLVLQSAPNVQVQVVRHTVSATDQKPRLEKLNDGFRLVYKNLHAAKQSWPIKLTLDFRRNGDSFEITGDLQNDAQGWFISEFNGPALTGIQADLTTQPLLWPVGLGQRITAAPAPASSRNKTSSTFRAANWKLSNTTAELSFSYPSSMGTMQWCAFAGAQGGVYLGNHDPLHGAKNFMTWYDFKSEKMNLVIKYRPLCARGQHWQLPPLVIRPYAGSWHVAAQHYRTWFDTNTKLQHVPDWVASTSGWLLCILKQQNGSVMWDYPSLEQLCDIADQRGLDILGLFGWAQGGHDHEYPDYIPDPKMGGPEALRRSLAEVHRRGKRSIIYANGQLMDTETDFYRTQGKDLAVIQENGGPVAQNWQKYKSFPAVRCTLACHATQGWYDRMLALAIQAQALGADGILFDQLGMSGPMVCFATNHLHAAPAMSYAADRIMLIRRIADHMKTVAPNFIVMTEGLHDSILDSISMFHGCVLGEFTPTAAEMAERIKGTASASIFPELFRFTFPEIISTQRHPTPMLNRLAANYACVYGLRHEIESRYEPDVRYLKTGYVPAVADYSDILNPPTVTMMAGTPPAEATRYLKQLIDFERRHADVLWRGRFVDDVGFAFKGEGLMAKGFSSGKQLAVVVWNPTDKPVPCTLAVANARLVQTTEPEQSQVDSSSPLPPETIRLLRWEKN